MRIFGFATFSFLLGMGLSLASYAMDISVVGTGTFSTLNLVDSGTKYKTTSSFGPGAGILFHKRLSRGFGVEVGALYIERKYSLTGTLLGIDWSRTEVDHAGIIPLTLTLHPFRYLSFGAGGYLGREIGSRHVTQTALGASTTFTESGSGSKNELGLIGDVCLSFPVAQRIALRLDGTYLYGLNNVGSDGNTVKFRDTIVLAGLRFFF